MVRPQEQHGELPWTYNIHIDLIPSPSTCTMLPRGHRYSLMYLQGASTLFKLRGLTHAQLFFQNRGDSSRVSKRDYQETPQLNNEHLRRPISDHQRDIRGRAQRPEPSRYMTRGRCKRLGVEVWSQWDTSSLGYWHTMLLSGWTRPGRPTTLRVYLRGKSIPILFADFSLIFVFSAGTYPRTMAIWAERSTGPD